MQAETHHNRLIDLAGKATERVLLIAPFIKTAILGPVLDAADDVQRVDVFTRWRPEEIAAGVSDLDVWCLCCGQRSRSLWLCGALHAKCYIFDDVAIVGSGNLTAHGLGTHGSPNLEFLTEMQAEHPDIVRLLESLETQSVRATSGDYRRYRDAAAALRIPDRDRGYMEMTQRDESGEEQWLPQSRHPEELIKVYMGDADEVSRSAGECAEYDLCGLHVPTGLDEAQLRVYIKACIFQLPMFAEVAAMAGERRRYGEYRDMIRRRLSGSGVSRDGDEVWQIMLRWILYFADDEYFLDVPRHSEILCRREYPEGVARAFERRMGDG